jgi:hypothetical protein
MMTTILITTRPTMTLMKKTRRINNYGPVSTT